MECRMNPSFAPLAALMPRRRSARCLLLLATALLTCQNAPRARAEDAARETLPPIDVTAPPP
ncbi:hypothetical protein CCR94_21895, partial [Rhodoblastus sphagnicola]